MQAIISSIRQTIRHHLNRIGCKYDYSAVMSKTYNGEGFYINSRTKAAELNRIWGYDINWAYGGVLRNNILPKTCRLGAKETELGIFLISYKKIGNARYKDFHYTLYRKIKGELEKNVVELGNGRQYRFVTNLDYLIFKDLYKVEGLRIEKQAFFQDLGKLELEEIIDRAYIDKKRNAYPKNIFESCYYGLNAKKLWTYDNPKDYQKYIDSYNATGYSWCRSRYVPIAMFQTAYLRYEEWQLFKKYRDKIVYMNTDSIYTTEPVDIEDSSEIGHYHIEYNGEYIQFIRRSAYAILDNRKILKEAKISGVLNEYVTNDDIKALRAGKIIKCKSRDEFGKIVDIKVEPTFIRYYNGDTFNIKYSL